MDVALVRSDMSQHEQAVADSAAALEIGNGHARVDLLLNRGYVLRAAGQLREAAEVYARARELAQETGSEEQVLGALLHLTGLHRQLDEPARQQALSAEALARTQALGDDYFPGYASSSRALALAAGGAIDQASSLFADGRARLDRLGEHTHLSESLALWAAQLARHGRYADAYRALADSHDIVQAQRKATREHDARYLSGLLDAGQKDLAIERPRREN